MEVLEVENLEQSYGGLNILEGISFSIKTGERRAIIGPNGAGKTTLFNVLCGFVPSKAGRIRLLDHDITNIAPNKRIALGLARSFQITTLFPTLSVLNNVLLAIQGLQSTRFQLFRPISSYKDNIARARELLEMVDLWDKRNSSISELAHGQQRQIEIILAAASKPKLLLLDEPNAGLTRAESDSLIDFINNLLGETTVLLTAHDMDLVFKLSQQIMVLYYGKIIAEGTPQQIQADSKVREIYLGVDRGA
jgi:branched-chain amino acid transport system ATP-binding protein